MGKKLKYCNSCEEGFAERFTFCPTCGGWLETVEMSPVAEQAAHADDIVPAAEMPEPKFEVLRPAVNEPPARIEEPEIQAPEIHAVEPEPVSFAEETSGPEILAAQEPYIESIREEPEHIVEASAAGSYSDQPATTAFSEPAPAFTAPSSYAYRPDDDFHVTVIKEQNTSRNSLLLGSTVLVICTVLFLTVYSLYKKDFSIASLGDDNVLAFLPQIDPDEVEIEKPEIQKKDKSGGGGGGGGDEQTPASKGAPPPMMSKPLVAPDAHATRLTDPLVMPVGVKGPDQPKIDPSQRYGVLNGADGESNGPGTGGGIGTGRGGGVGSGNGSGLGSGSGGGAGAGTGGGIGDGDGTGGGPPGVIPKGESTALAITAKPRPNYTDAARQANIQGVVRLKVTFLANGSIGSISAISGLPNGLTEQAIAAAKNMRFTPKKVNGVPQSVARVVEFSFTIY
ncbi:MAG: TonB family protein [Acidobacteriota bacterium]